MSQDPVRAAEPGHPRRASRIVVVLVAVAVLGAAVLALVAYVALEDEGAGAAAQAATAVDPATLPASLPFRLVAGHIVVEAEIGSADGALQFMLDSGAPVLYAADVAERYGGEPVGRIATRAIDGTVAEPDVVAIERLRLGGAEFLDVAGPVGWVGDGNPLACVTRSGLLGANLMDDAVWQIDYQAESIGIHRSTEGLDHIDEAISLEFRVDSDASPSPIVTVPLADGELTFLLDTGSDGALMVNPADLEVVGLQVADDAPTLTVLGAGAAGTFETELRYADLELALDGEVTGYPVAVSETLQPGVGNMGNGFLRQFVVTIDWPERMVYLDPVATDRSIDPPAGPASAGLAWDDGRVVVGALARGGPAEQAGLELGDAVRVVDGVDLAAPTFDDYCDLLTRPSAGVDVGGATVVTADGTYRIEVVEGFYD